MNDCCKAGIKYADVRTNDRPYKFPCLNQGGECNTRKFKTQDEVKAELDELGAMSLKSITMFAKVKDHFDKHKSIQGELDCDCGGKIKYVVAQNNGHIWAKCFSCGISFIE